MVKFATDHKDFKSENVSPARARGTKGHGDNLFLSPSPKMKRDDSQGSFAALFERGDQRRHGTELIARQVELENMRASQQKIKNFINERDKDI